MEKMFNIFSILLGICGGVMGYLFGGFDILVVTLLCMTVLDYVTGVLNAYMQKKLSSNVGFKGIVKKVMIYIVVVCSVYHWYETSNVCDKEYLDLYCYGISVPCLCHADVAAHGAA